MASTFASTLPKSRHGKRVPSSSSSSSEDLHNPRTSSGVWKIMHDSLFNRGPDVAKYLRSELDTVMSTDTPQGEDKDDIDRLKIMWKEISASDATEQEMRDRWISKPRRLSCIRMMIPDPSTFKGTTLDESLIQRDKITPPPTSRYRQSRTTSTKGGRSTSRKGSGEISLDEKRGIWRKQLSSYVPPKPLSDSPSSLAISKPASSMISSAA